MHNPLSWRPAPLRTHIFSLIALTLLAATMPLAPAQAHPAHESHPAAPIAESLTLTVNGSSTQLTPAALAAMPQTTVTVHNAHANADEQYTGVALSDLLATAGAPMAPGAEHRFFQSYLRAQGTDFYFVLFSGTEIESTLHKGNVLVALRHNGQPLTTEGRFKLVSTEDTRPARWVRNLTSLTLTTVN